MTRTSDAVELFAAEPSYIEDVNGKRHEILRRTARMELRISLILTRHVERLKDVDWPEADLADRTNETILSYLPIIIERCPEVIAEVAGCILGCDPETTLDLFFLDDLVEVIAPFLAGQVKLLARFTKIIQQATRPSLRPS